MKAKELLRRYDNGSVDATYGGMIFGLWFENLEEYVTHLFGKGSEILFGELECGKDYVYAYAEGEEYPDGFGDDDTPSMCVEVGDGQSVWIYEIED